MANILVYIELEDGDASPVSLSALNLGRKVASRLGAALYAILPCNVPPTYEENDVITVISQHGADKVILLTNPGLELPPSEEVLGPVLANACKRFPPRAVLLPAADSRPDLGGTLSAAIGGAEVAFPPAADDGEDLTDDEALSRRLSEEDETPLVVTIDGVPAPVIMGEDDTEVVVFQASLEKEG